MVIQYQVDCSKPYIYKSNTKCTQEGVGVCGCVFVCVSVCITMIIKKKESMDLRWNRAMWDMDGEEGKKKDIIHFK